MKKLIHISTIALVICIAGACEDKLDIVNPNRASDKGYYATEAEAVAAVDAAYNPLIIDGQFQRITPIYNDGRGDELLCRSPWGFMIGFSNFTFPPGADAAEDIVWWGYYIMILRANQAIEAIPTIEGLDQALADRLMGQVLFLRAFAHFQLGNIYGNPPIITSVPKNQDEYYASNAGVTKSMVYDQVEADLLAALPLLPPNYDNVSGPDQGQIGRVTSGACNALLGKLHLYRATEAGVNADYAAAEPYFAAVVNSGEYSLAPNYQDLFSGDPALEQADPGKIFWAEFTTSANPEFNWCCDPNVNWRQFLALTPTYSVTDFYDFRPTQFLYDEMREELTVDGKLDPRYQASIASYEPAEDDTIAWGRPWVQAPPEGNGFAPEDFFIAKFTYANIGGGDAFTAGFNYPIIRYADVLLLYAECLANNGNIAQAASYVQQVRNRANLPDRQAEFAGYSLSQFMEQLAHERVTELAIEGHRWYDIMRWGWLEDPNRLAELQANNAEFNTFVPERKVMPIPLSELNTNPNLVGNAAN